MFSTTAYEAFYSIIGLHFHEASIKIITSQAILAGILALTFGAAFFFAVWGYFKRYLPGPLGGGFKGATLGTFVKLLASFLLGVSLLKVGSFTNVRDHKRVTWHGNNYITTKVIDLQENYKVSFVFDILTQSAEEMANFLGMVVDRLFEKTNSEQHAPSAFYKAILYAGSVSIEDPKLRSMVDLYSGECFDKVIPQLELANREDKISEFFKPYGVVDNSLKEIKLPMQDGSEITCYDLKEKVNDDLYNYARRVTNKTSKYDEVVKLAIPRDSVNEAASSALNNYFTEKAETHWLNIQRGAEIPTGGFAKYLMGWKRLTSWDGVLSLFGGEKYEAANLTAERAMQFNEYLKRAPHLKGMVKLFLIAAFPWLIFFVFAGKWKIIISWWAVYFSVLLWTPLWTLLYHLMTTVALSTDVLEAFGRLNDGVSLYSSELITNKIYQFYAIYSYLQLIVGPLPTVILAWGMFTGFLNDRQQESTPDAISTVTTTGIATATGGVGAGVKTAAGSVAKGVKK